MKLTESQIQLSATDLVNFLGCKNLTELDRSVLLDERKNPDWNDPSLAILQQKGLEHEAAYTEWLRMQGFLVHQLTEHSNKATLEAMQKGYDYILQASLSAGTWSGRADFLRKVSGKSKLGDFHYEVEDTKLAQETKAGTVLQLCLYTEILAGLQDRAPEKMYVIKPGDGFPKDSYRYAEFSSYYQFIKGQFEGVIQNDPKPTYPMPVAKCSTCRWWKECDTQWHTDDHLSLIAGIRSMHLKELERQQIKTLEAYANEESAYRDNPEQGNRETFEKLHKQASIQLKGRKAGQILYDLLPAIPERGLNRLPDPCAGDIYFDIEGDHFFEDGGLEYLLGLSAKNKENQLQYQCFWAKNRAEEKAAFESFMDYVIDRWGKYPDMYIYHYAPYEPTAVKRLASKHATRELEVDMLLRGERFIDIFSVLKETLQASVESYSLKDVEALAGLQRKADLRESSAARRRIAKALEFKSPDSIPEPDIKIVEAYNQDDCLATAALHGFLESLYTEQSKAGWELSRAELKDGKSSDAVDEMDEEAQQLFRELVKSLPADPGEWNTEEKAKWLLAHMVEYFRREEKSSWWEFFRLNDLEAVDLYDERKAIAGLTFIDTHADSQRVPIHNYQFPPQEISLSSGDELWEVKGGKTGSVYSISPEEGTVAIKKMAKTAGQHPYAVHQKDLVGSSTLASSLREFIRSVITHGIDKEGPYRAGRDLLLRHNPRLLNDETTLPKDSEEHEDTALRIALNLDNSILPIQGPPSTGKTHVGGGVIAELVSKGKKVGVTAISHKVILNLLEKAQARGVEKGIEVAIKHKVSSNASVPKGDPVSIKKVEDVLPALEEGCVVGGTSWLWADERMVETLDYLFVDEAGQMSLANVLSVCRATSNIVLLGDPQQLEQPQKGAHPEGADVSALQHVLGNHQTIPPEKGLFLDTTWRLNPNIASFTSELYYDGRLRAKEELQNQLINGKDTFAGGGLYYIPVAHYGNQNKSTEEVEEIVRIVNQMLDAKLTWTNRDGKTQSITTDDIVIVAPYNAQVSALYKALPRMRIGTVDKFQGQEAPIVIYSMTSSSPEDAPRGMHFLYNPNRLNVATSRAQCICILVASPTLFEPECHSIDQMKWANGLCRYREVMKK